MARATEGRLSPVVPPAGEATVAGGVPQVFPAAAGRSGGPAARTPGRSHEDGFDRLVDQSSRLVGAAITTWAAATKGWAATEPGAVLTTALVSTAARWFDWAKTVQGLPHLGGAGHVEGPAGDRDRRDPAAWPGRMSAPSGPVGPAATGHPPASPPPATR